MQSKISTILQYVLAVAILGGLIYTYWYSRNFIAGYYELTWYAGDDVIMRGKSSIAIFLTPVVAIAGYAIYYKLKGCKNKEEKE